ncbi:energy-coupling factor transport system ATP-binding protein [Oceanotoga teriensis]|uniref:Energy-coupling factor transport system ATP-binding protein n=2 Tax=Oceanotoga TaxID=1255275 RepID=A0AA45C7B3_9BACT|nr:ABC transporter ATP-binding protein [Oceanotoga teriensis]PWJ95297.1 energy-coupling factor transport system ATP-binding protein [Oceanotoga teriensis]
MIELKNIIFGYNKDNIILKNINLNILKNECILLCGKSGSGKTTLTKLINGIIPHLTENFYFNGKVLCNDFDIKNHKMYEISRIIGSVFQNPKSQFFNIDSNSEIVFGLENNGIPQKNIELRLKETINSLKIEKLLNRNIFKMSGGEKQSLAFASVFAMNPEVFVLDEPTANLDEESISVLKNILKKIKSEGKTIIIAEHRLFYLKDIVDRVVLMKDGYISKIFNSKDFFSLNFENRVDMGLRSINKETINLKNTPNVYSKNILKVNNLSCKIKNKIIFNNISFEVKQGEILGVLGKNGSGKSTLMRCITGLIKEYEGYIKFNDIKLNHKKRIDYCYMIMQDVNHQLFSESVWNECNIDGHSNDLDIENVLNNFNLIDFKDSHPMSLSGGQKQRLAIATGILSNKKILIFDEPTSGLDYDNMIKVSSMIKKLSKNHIIIVITHDIEFLNNTCSKILQMNNF